MFFLGAVSIFSCLIKVGGPAVSFPHAKWFQNHPSSLCRSGPKRLSRPSEGRLNFLQQSTKLYLVHSSRREDLLLRSAPIGCHYPREKKIKVARISPVLPIFTKIDLFLGGLLHQQGSGEDHNSQIYRLTGRPLVLFVSGCRGDILVVSSLVLMLRSSFTFSPTLTNKKIAASQVDHFGVSTYSQTNIQLFISRDKF